MKKWLLLIVLISNNLFGQSLDSIKHVEIISDVKDSMALINKNDIDKINKTFYELEVLSELNEINDSIINTLIVKNNKLDSIVVHQKAIIANEQCIKTQLIENHSFEVNHYKKELKKSNNKKIVWQSTTGISLLTIIIILLI